MYIKLSELNRPAANTEVPTCSSFTRVCVDGNITNSYWWLFTFKILGFLIETRNIATSTSIVAGKGKGSEVREASPEVEGPGGISKD